VRKIPPLCICETVKKNSYIVDEINNFSYSLKINARKKNKIYCIDNGLINVISFKFLENKGKRLENFVLNEFRKLGYSEIYFYNQEKECDFILKKDNKLCAVQVAYELNAQNNAREINGLLNAKRKFWRPEFLFFLAVQPLICTALQPAGAGM